MAALVPELVNMASDPNVSTSELLRRALVVATRLDVSDFSDWLQCELNGYVGYAREDIPAYRTVQGQLWVKHPAEGLIPYIFSSAEMKDLVTTHAESQSVPELESIAQSSGDIGRTLPPRVEQMLMAKMPFRMRPYLLYSVPQVKGIVEKVRNRILSVALDLERRGIRGEGLTFTKEEKQVVQHSHSYIFGDVSSSQIQIASSGGVQTQANTSATIDIEAVRGLIEGLTEAIERGQLQGEIADELRAELSTLKAQAASPKPKWDVIRATARSIKTVAEGVAGGLIANLAQPHVATLLALAAGAVGVGG